MRDFTEGSILKQVVEFSVPMLLANLLQAAYSIIDAMWVGRLIGHEAFAAVSSTMPLIFFLLSAIIGLTIATNILIGQAFGSKNMKLLSKVLTNSFLGTASICIVLSVLGIIFSRDLLKLVNTPPELSADARIFFMISVGGLIFGFVYNWFAAILRGLGDAKTPFYLLIVSVCLNIVLEPLLIKGFGPLPALGVAGSALGTIIASVVMLALAYFFVLRKHPLLNVHTWDFTFDLSIWRRIFAIGIPVSFQMVVVSFSNVLIVSLVNTFGVKVMAAYGIGIQVDQIALMSSMAIGMSVSSIVAQNLGARKFDRVKSITRISALMSFSLSFALFVIVYIFPVQIASIFTGEPAVLESAKEYMRIVSFSYCILALMFTLQGIVRGAGDTVYMLIFTVIGFVVIRYPLAYALSKFTSLREHGIWGAVLAGAFVGLCLNYWYYRSGRWKEKVIVPHGPQIPLQGPAQETLPHTS